MAIDGHIYIGELAERLDRAEHTIRQWTRRDDFPPALEPFVEGGRGKLYWTEDQIAGLSDYATDRAAHRGSFGRPVAP